MNPQSDRRSSSSVAWCPYSSRVGQFQHRGAVVPHILAKAQGRADGQCRPRGIPRHPAAPSGQAGSSCAARRGRRECGEGWDEHSVSVRPVERSGWASADCGMAGMSSAMRTWPGIVSARWPSKLRADRQAARSTCRPWSGKCPAPVLPALSRLAAERLRAWNRNGLLPSSAGPLGACLGGMLRNAGQGKAWPDAAWARRATISFPAPVSPCRQTGVPAPASWGKGTEPPVEPFRLDHVVLE